MSATVTAHMVFSPASETGGPVRHVDLRAPSDQVVNVEATEVAVMNAHEHADLGLHSSGFELVRSPSAVTDFYDCDLVMGTYYEECGATARELTGAHTTFTFDHIIREPGCSSRAAVWMVRKERPVSSGAGATSPACTWTIPTTRRGTGTWRCMVNACPKVQAASTHSTSGVH